MENISETGRLYEVESQIKIIRTDPVERSRPVDPERMEATSDSDGSVGIVQAPGVKPAPDREVKPARDEMKAGYRYASGLYHDRFAKG
jgi:hypothetical protein